MNQKLLNLSALKLIPAPSARLRFGLLDGVPRQPGMRIHESHGGGEVAQAGTDGDSEEVDNGASDAPGRQN